MVNPVGKRITNMQRRLQQKPEERLPLGVKPMDVWGDLKKQHFNVMEAAEITAGITLMKLNLVNTTQRSKCIKDPVYFSGLVNSLTADIADYKKKILEVFEQHRHKSGPTNNPDDYMLSLHLHGRYNELTEVFNEVTLPTISELSKIFDEIELEFSKLSVEEVGEVQPEYIESSPVNSNVVDVEFVEQPASS